MALISALALAAPSFAADTGMLYVKSNPSGATVVVEGKERGKTPVLVKGLSAGELTVELRITGVKPVTRQATVKANRVSTVDVIIDVPGASLTVLSDPLEATVFLDDREVGSTPLTLEHLDPGEHRIVLLKGDYPRTARSVVLEPGGERVLEVKLGTGGAEETDAPAPGVAPAAPQAAEPTSVKVQLILAMLKDAVVKVNYAGTRRNLEAALRQADMADFKDEIRSAIRVMRALEGRRDAMMRAAEGLVEKDVSLKTKTGVKKGRVEAASRDGIVLALKIIIDGQAVGETHLTVKWSDLSVEEADRLAASWKPEGPDGAVARAILAQAGGNKAAAERAARGAGEHPLGKCLTRKRTMPVDEAAERAARSAWSVFKRVRLGSAAGARYLAKMLASFREKHGQTRFALSVREELAALEASVELVANLPPDAVHFGGHWYKLYEQAKRWHDAKEYCEQVGGHLVTISSKQEDRLVLNLHAAARSKNTWIGLSHEGDERGWQWVTGEKLGFTAWLPGQSDGSAGNQVYGQIWTDGPRIGWDNTRTDNPHWFICEWEVAGAGEASSPGGRRR